MNMSGLNSIPTNGPHIYLAFSFVSNRFRDAFDSGRPFYAQGPKILISFAYWDQTLRDYPSVAADHEWILDSGAFTAWNSGTPIRLEQYMEFCRSVQQGPHPPKHIFGLDVIGDWEATAQNNEHMKKAGLTIVPCFHFGEPVEALHAMADYDYIAFGGLVGLEAGVKRRWLDWAFSQCWPKKVHGFGLGPGLWQVFPFYSCDCSDWSCCTRFGNWSCFSGQNIGVKNAHELVRPELEYWLREERYAKARWAEQFHKLGWT